MISSTPVVLTCLKSRCQLPRPSHPFFAPRNQVRISGTVERVVFEHFDRSLLERWDQASLAWRFLVVTVEQQKSMFLIQQKDEFLSNKAGIDLQKKWIDLGTWSIYVPRLNGDCVSRFWLVDLYIQVFNPWEGLTSFNPDVKEIHVELIILVVSKILYLLMIPIDSYFWDGLKLETTFVVLYQHVWFGYVYNLIPYYDLIWYDMVWDDMILYQKHIV